MNEIRIIFVLRDLISQWRRQIHRHYKIMLEIADRQMYGLLRNHQETHPIHPEGRHSADFQKVRPKLRLEGRVIFLG